MDEAREKSEFSKKNKYYQVYKDFIWNRYDFESFMDENQYSYLYGLVTGTSAYTNNAGTASWAREQLVDAYFESKEAEYVALFALGMAGGIGGKSVVKNNPSSKVKFGANGVKVTSKTIWKENGSKARIDVENPNPGQRAGQIHYQDANNNKYLYDPNKKVFVDLGGNLAPKSVNNMLKDPRFIKKLNVGLTQYLGESPYSP